MPAIVSVEVTSAALHEKTVLRHLLELYKYDFSEFTGEDVDAHGLFGYRYLDHYWTEPARWPFLFKVRPAAAGSGAEGRLAGFALVSDRTILPENAGGFDLAEFFVLRRHRRQGIGVAAAGQLFDRFPGRWEVRALAENTGTVAFWRRAIGACTGGAFQEVILDNDAWRGPVQSFVAAGPGARARN
ncbi:MAG TPA: GNAT family N-acetyltransferase [Dehalococcoidia bacterium]|nr:GNAT family N-acetyltransferase [Dehalococcoidia bacterium]